MKKLNTEKYNEKVAYLPSMKALVEKAGTLGEKALSGDAAQGFFRGMWLGQGGALGGILHSLQGAGSSESMAASDDLKRRFEDEFRIVSKDPNDPGNLMKIIYDNVAPVMGGHAVRISENPQLLAQNEARRDQFMKALRETLLHADRASNISGMSITIKLIDAKDRMGNPHKDRSEMHKRILATFGSWFPAYYNKAVDAVKNCRSIGKC